MCFKLILFTLVGSMPHAMYKAAEVLVDLVNCSTSCGIVICKYELENMFQNPWNECLNPSQSKGRLEVPQNIQNQLNKFDLCEQIV